MILREELEQIKVKVSINKGTGKFTLAPSTIDVILEAVRKRVPEPNYIHTQDMLSSARAEGWAAAINTINEKLK